MVNRLLKTHTGPTLKNVTGFAPGVRYFDLYNGVELKLPHGSDTLPLVIERFGAVVATDKGPEVDPKLKELMTTMASYAKVPLADLDATWHFEDGVRVPIARAEAPIATEGMTRIPGGALRFAVRGIEIEGGGAVGDPRKAGVDPFGVDFQYEWEG
eukprot:SAG11_NODE_4480_length_1880_cov_0.888827_3_plen_155_part_01